MYNYQKVRIPLKTSFNLTKWRHLLHNYYDLLVVDFLEFGFPLFCLFNSYVLHTDNHSSAVNYPSDIEQYLSDEIKYGSILGPFDNPPLSDLHCSPMLSRPRDGTNRQVIVDFSWLHGNSVNSNTSTIHYSDLNTVELISQRVLQLGTTALLYKVDIKRAFRNCKIDLLDVNLLGL